MTRRSQYRLPTFVLQVVLVLSMSATGCSSPASGSAAATTTAGGPIRIVAVERVYGDLATQIGAGAVSVDTILNSPSADPHAYEPSTADADAIAGADIVIENGLGYDAFAEKLLAASPKSDRVVIDVGARAGHHVGDNPHVWYEASTLRLFVTTLTAELVERDGKHRDLFALNRNQIQKWLRGFEARVTALGRRNAGAPIAITEPVFDYVLNAARLKIATPVSFSHAIEEGNDPAPQDVDTMRSLLASHGVAAFVYNRQTVEPSTERLLDVAKHADVHVVSVTETLPANTTTQAWIDGEVAALERAL